VGHIQSQQKETKLHVIRCQPQYLMRHHKSNRKGWSVVRRGTKCRGQKPQTRRGVEKILKPLNCARFFQRQVSTKNDKHEDQLLRNKKTTVVMETYLAALAASSSFSLVF